MNCFSLTFHLIIFEPWLTAGDDPQKAKPWIEGTTAVGRKQAIPRADFRLHVGVKLVWQAGEAHAGLDCCALDWKLDFQPEVIQASVSERLTPGAAV